MNFIRDLGFWTKKPPRKLDVTYSLIEKWLKFGKSYFTGLLYVLRFPFIPTNPLFATMSFFFLFCFCFLNLVRSSFSKPNTSKSNFCVKLFSCKLNFVSRIFLGPLLQNPPNMGPLKLIFLIAQARVIVFFDISRSLSDKCFDIVWGYHHPPRALKRIPQNQFLIGST